MGVRGQLSGLPPSLIGGYDTISGAQSSDVGAAGWTQGGPRVLTSHAADRAFIFLITLPLNTHGS